MSEVPGTAWREGGTPQHARPLPADWMRLATPVEHVFTHFALRLTVERAEIASATLAPDAHWWAPADTLAEEALPSVMKKVIEAAYPGATLRPGATQRPREAS